MCQSWHVHLGDRDIGWWMFETACLLVQDGRRGSHAEFEPFRNQPLPIPCDAEGNILRLSGLTTDSCQATIIQP